MSELLLRGAELDGDRRVDVRVEGGHITEIAAALPRRVGETVYDCAGGALLPGLCDHHLHLHAIAAADHSVECGPPTVTDRSALGAALTTAPGDEHGWVRGVGYVETVAGPLDAVGIDRLHDRRPVRIQHRSGALWMLNTAACDVLGLRAANHPGVERDVTGAPTGRVWRADAWLRELLPRQRPPDLTGVAARLSRFGITAVTDATPDLTPETVAALADARRAGVLPQRVHLLGHPLDGAAPPELTIGPRKIVLADSGLPTLDALTAVIAHTHDVGRAAAVHCVSRTALVLLLAAFDMAGHRPGDRIEHAGEVPAELLARLAALGVRVVTQPGFLTHRGDDFLAGAREADHADLYRVRSLLDHRVPVALSSDAPYGPLDPWAVMAAAVHRRTPAGCTLTAAERITARQALDGYLGSPEDPGGPPRRLRPGVPADLVVLRTPLAAALADPTAESVRLTVIDGTPCYSINNF